LEAALALLLPLIGGNLYVRGCTTLRYKAAREDGHRFYFRVAYHGVVLFAVSAVLLILIDWVLGRYLWYLDALNRAVRAFAPLLKEPKNSAGQAGFLAICLFAVFLGRLSPFLVNRLFKSRQEVALWEAASENELEEFLLDALARLKTIAITLTSGKVYVGYVLTTPEPRTDRRVIAMLPLMSGYREEDGGKVVFTTFYDQFYSGDPDEDSEDFKIILPTDKMMSLSFFNVDVYARFNEEEAAPTDAEEAASTSWRKVKVAEAWQRGRVAAQAKLTQ
jgi:hypothetical protein